MKKALFPILAMAIVLSVFMAYAWATEPDSLKVKNKVGIENQGADQRLRVRVQERIQSGRTDDAQEGVQVRTEEGDKAKGQAVQARFRDEDGDGIPDSSQAKKQERNRHRVRTQEGRETGTSGNNMTPQGAPAGSQQRKGSSQGSGSRRR